MYSILNIVSSMSYSFVLSCNTSTLTAEFHPPIYLDEDYNYVIGLINFETFNAIPNIDETNNKIIYDMFKEFNIPSGSYEIDDLNNFWQKHFDMEQKSFHLFANNNTLRIHIKTTFPITFKKGTLGKI